MLAGTCQLFGVAVSYEPFNYTNGSLVTVSGGAWNTHSGTAGQIKVTSGHAFITQTNSEDVNVTLDEQPYLATSDAVLYSRFILNASSLPSGTGTYFAHYHPTT